MDVELKKKKKFKWSEIKFFFELQVWLLFYKQHTARTKKYEPVVCIGTYHEVPSFINVCNSPYISSKYYFPFLSLWKRFFFCSTKCWFTKGEGVRLTKNEILPPLRRELNIFVRKDVGEGAKGNWSAQWGEKYFINMSPPLHGCQGKFVFV